MLIKNLVFEGGGIKGIAYVGALQELTRQGHLQSVDHVAGASAGAITALILGLGYTVTEIEALLDTDFGRFEDGSKLKLGKALSFYKTFGLNPGKAFEDWIKPIIADKLGTPDATFEDLHQKVIAQHQLEADAKWRDVYFIGSNLSAEKGELFSYLTTPKMPIVQAIRISMSIPIFFSAKIYRKEKQPSALDGQQKLIEDSTGDMYVDGGLVDNFPISLFDTEYPNPQTLGFKVDSLKEINYLRDRQTTAGKPITDLWEYGMALVNTAMSAQQKHHQLNNFRTVYIPDNGIGTTQFQLTSEEKHGLMKAGMKATLRYFATTFGNPYANQPGQKVVADKQRHDKFDRYAIYAKTSGFHYRPGQARVQLVFILTTADSDWRKLQDKVSKYYHRLQGQVGIESLLHYKRVGGRVQVLVAALNDYLSEELTHWLDKHRPADVVYPTFIPEDKLILLAEYRPGLRPLWLSNYEPRQVSRERLFALVTLGDLEGVNRLLAEGTVPHYRNPRGDTLFHEAARHGHLGIINLLQERGLPVETTNHYGDTPLHRAVDPQMTGLDPEAQTVELLLSMGAQVDAANKQGNTPLMLAAEIGYLPAVIKLLQYGADCQCTNRQGYTALQKASYFKHDKVVAIFEQYQRNPASINYFLTSEPITPLLRQSYLTEQSIRKFTAQLCLSQCLGAAYLQVRAAGTRHSQSPATDDQLVEDLTTHISHLSFSPEVSSSAEQNLVFQLTRAGAGRYFAQRGGFWQVAARINASNEAQAHRSADADETDADLNTSNKTLVTHHGT